MMRISFGPEPRLREVLCIGAHCDDIEIGCGGALLELRSRYPDLKFHWFVLGGEAQRSDETRRAGERLFGASKSLTVEILNFRGSYFFAHAAEIKDAFEDIMKRSAPDLIFTHYLHDRHQDHRLLAELTWNTFRNHSVLEYEIPKYEGDLGHPSLYVPLSAASVETKVATLLECFPSQRQRSWFTADTFRALMRLRGVECNAESGFAEAFHARKLTL
jgi:LmbE family N-acetylglucosaminyl deacetylase